MPPPVLCTLLAALKKLASKCEVGDLAMVFCVVLWFVLWGKLAATIMHTNRVQPVIPEFNHSDVLPPFLGQSHSSATASPYELSATALVERFATSSERVNLLDGLFRFRAALGHLGFVHGFQWLDGSFVENSEKFRNHAPQDIDVVTFVYPPANMAPQEISAMMHGHPELFNRQQCLESYSCDTFLVRLNVPAHRLVRETTFWHGFFSHRRDDQVWKGLLQLPLISDDGEAKIQLENLNPGDNRVATT